MRDSADLESAPALVMLAAGMATRYGGGCKPLAPAGLHGEAIIDLNASDALAAGFGLVVVVVGPHSGPAIDYHVRRCWPAAVPVALAQQPVPLGTAHAALCAHAAVGGRRFALINADDIYGVASLAELCQHLQSTGENANVAYRLADTVVSDQPVTRGTCVVTADGLLGGMVERKRVARRGDGWFVADDGKEPKELDPDTAVSVNLWGFQPAVWPVLEQAVRAAHPGVGADGSVDGPLESEAEVLLPEVIGAMVAAGPAGGASASSTVRVLHGIGRCLGVTHLDDLTLVRAELAAMVGDGSRDAGLWTAI